MCIFPIYLASQGRVYPVEYAQQKYYIPSPQYFSVYLMKVFFCVLLHDGHKILTLAES